MQARLPDNIKSLVIQQWLEGKPRNDIAAENGLSDGAVTNIVNEWKLACSLILAIYSSFLSHHILGLDTHKFVIQHYLQASFYFLCRELL